MYNAKCVFLKMEKEKNPFPVSGYHGDKYFCDRDKELKRAIANIENGVNTTLLSIRRMGKTGLINHLFHKINDPSEKICIYFDLYATEKQKDFVDLLSSSLLQAFPKKSKIGAKILEYIKSLRPTLTFDQLTGMPTVSYTTQNSKENEESLNSLFRFLDKTGQQYVIAIDEFQQIANYPEKNTEAMLRTLIQNLKHVNFIFCGSSKHVLNEMFNNSKRPFFGSTQFIYLNEIENDLYASFINNHFIQNKIKIDENALQYVLDFSRRHTYYTQVICNRLYANNTKLIAIQDVKNICAELLKENEPTYLNYRNLLTTSQWNLLKAIAKEEKLYQPNSQKFIATYQLGTPSNVQRSLESLLKKEMIFKEENSEGVFYSVYDCFLSRWLEIFVR